MYRKQFISQLLKWTVIYFAIALGILFLIPFPWSILAMIGIIILLSYYVRKRQLRRDDTGTFSMLVPKFRELVLIRISFAIVLASTSVAFTTPFLLLLPCVLISLCVIKIPTGKNNQNNEVIILGVLMAIIGGMSLSLVLDLPREIALFSSVVNKTSVLSFEVLAVIVSVRIAIGVASLGLAYDIFKRIGHAAWKMTWIVNIILSIIIVISFPLNLTLTPSGNTQHLFASIMIVSAKSIVMSGLIFYYLYRPNVKRYFGKISSNSTVS